MSQSLQLLTFGLLAAGGNLLGGWLIARSQSAGNRKLKHLLAFGAGFMLAAVILEVIPESLQQPSSSSQAMIWLLAGYLVIQLVEHTIAPHFHFGEEVHTEEMHQSGVAITAIAALALHAFFDGVTIASGLLVNFRLGLLLFLAVLLHKVPEGITVASIMMSAGKTGRSALNATLLIAIATFAGIFCVTMIEKAVTFALPLSAGATLYIATSDLIPEINREGGWRASLFIFVGVAVFYVAHLLLHSLLG